MSDYSSSPEICCSGVKDGLRSLDSSLGFKLKERSVAIYIINMQCQLYVASDIYVMFCTSSISITGRLFVCNCNSCIEYGRCDPVVYFVYGGINYRFNFLYLCKICLLMSDVDKSPFLSLILS